MDSSPANGRLLVETAAAAGLDFYTGVPCSLLTPLLSAVTESPRATYVGAASEGEAVGIAAGAWLAGRGAAVMGQNSGLGNMVNPLTSLSHPFAIPSLLLVSWRGQPGIRDEPQHELMGRAIFRLLAAIEIAGEACPDDGEGLLHMMSAAAGRLAGPGLPHALVVPQGLFGEAAPPRRPERRPIRPALRRGRQSRQRPHRAAVLERVLAVLPEAAAVIATTGMTGRELFTIADRPQHFYLVGAMGCACPVGLGVALGTRDLPVVVLDGDGALLMKLGAMATVGQTMPPRLIHCLLDNGVHDSTGGQQTASDNVDWVAVAGACGYASVRRCSLLHEVEEALRHALAGRGPSFLHIPIRPGSMTGVGRPTVTPREVAARFRSFLEPFRNRCPA